MKSYVSVLLALGQLAAVGHTLDTRADAKDQTKCYKLGAAVEHTTEFNSNAACSEDCVEEGHTFFALRGSACMCLDSMPSDDKKADESKCDVPCPGYGLYPCGGEEAGYYSVGEIDPYYFNNSTNTSSADDDSYMYYGTIGTATATQTYTNLPSYSRVPSNTTATSAGSAATPSESGSASGSAASPVETTNAAAPVFDASFTVFSSLVGAVALLAALI